MRGLSSKGYSGEKGKESGEDYGPKELGLPYEAKQEMGTCLD